MTGQPTLPFVQSSRTSRAAADSMTEQAPTMRDQVFSILKHYGPVTDEVGAELAGLSPNTWRPRRVELARMGAIRKCDEKGRTRSGRKAARWETA